ncbi:MAG: hypothetical protein LBQ54_03910 [Planctomycetaceae bacterium]|jgi:hypothetical protein|nr:hypothetical protein [Planctomycetaceae bacterium]
MKNLFFLLIGTFLLFFSGCNGNVSVSGKVTFSDDDMPVPGGTICFVSGNNAMRGRINEDGTYVMGMTTGKGGIPKGDYDVYFLGTEAVAGFHPTEPGHEPEPKYVSYVDTKFLSASTSGLTVKIEGKTINLDFKVDRNPNFPKGKKLSP